MYVIPLDVPGSVAIVPRPRGGADLAHDIRALRMTGITVLVSLLPPDEAAALGLGDEAAECRRHAIEHVTLPVADFAVPGDADAFGQAARELGDRALAGGRVAIHCRGSVGRSGVLAVAIGLSLGLELEDAIARVSKSRGVAVPETAAQRAWLRGNEAALRGRWSRLGRSS